MKLKNSAAYLAPFCLATALSFSMASFALEPVAPPANPSMAGHSGGSMQLHRTMAQGHNMRMPMSGNVDKDFAMMMTMHHQQAIEMADVLIERGQSAELKALARKMKSAQQDEIKQMAKFAGPMEPMMKMDDSMKMDHSKMKMDNSSKMDHGKMADAEFAKLDQNKDGKVSKAEISSKHPMSPHFGMLDSNNDGSLSKAEFAKYQSM